MNGPVARGWLGVMVVHELNVLWNSPCCATCCAPCGVLKEMADTGIIHFYVRSAPNNLADGSAWWLPGGAVNLEWLEDAISGRDRQCH